MDSIKDITVTIRELYIFAQSHALLDKSIGLVIDEYIKHISVHNNTLAHSSIMNNQDNDSMSKSNIDYKNKVEFSTEDVLELFST
nr:MAG TPA: hypothetical protein [Crassvirales sp.]